MSVIQNQDLFCVVYDIERPWNKEWYEKAKKPLSELSESEIKELQKRKEWDRTIGRFVDDLSKIGWRINWSVYLIPDKFYHQAELLVKTYTQKFRNLGVRADIYILRYHPDSNQILIDKVKMHMKMKIDKFMKKLSETDDKNEQKFIRGQINTILDMAKVFGIREDIESYIEKVSIKYSVSITIATQKTLEQILLKSNPKSN